MFMKIYLSFIIQIKEERLFWNIADNHSGPEIKLNKQIC